MSKKAYQKLLTFYGGKNSSGDPAQGKSKVMAAIAKKRGVPTIEVKLSKYATFGELLKHSKE
jgi:hypothetical protein